MPKGGATKGSGGTRAGFQPWALYTFGGNGGQLENIAQCKRTQAGSLCYIDFLAC
jgi:hypothetical protein